LGTESGIFLGRFPIFTIYVAYWFTDN